MKLVNASVTVKYKSTTNTKVIYKTISYCINFDCCRVNCIDDPQWANSMEWVFFSINDLRQTSLSTGLSRRKQLRKNKVSRRVLLLSLGFFCYRFQLNIFSQTAMRRTRCSRNASQNTVENGDVKSKTGWWSFSLTVSQLG